MLGRAAGEDAGTYAYTLGTLDAGNNYTLTMIADPNVFEITKKQLIVTPAINQTKVYGDTDPVLSYTNTPLVGTDVIAGVLGRAAGEDAGTYAYTLGTLDAGNNYTLTMTADPDQFLITRKQIVITPALGQSKVYGDTDKR